MANVMAVKARLNCFELLKETAEQQGQLNADNMCLSQGGAGETATCLTQCDPEQLDAGAALQAVTCQSTCEESCSVVY